MCLPWFWANLLSVQICLYLPSDLSFNQRWSHYFLLSEQKLSLQGILCSHVWNCSECRFKVQSIKEWYFLGSCYNIRDPNSAKSLLQLPGNAHESWQPCLLQGLWQLEGFQQEGNHFQSWAAWESPRLTASAQETSFPWSPWLSPSQWGESKIKPNWACYWSMPGTHVSEA